MKRLFAILIISIIIATSLFFINRSVIVSSWTDNILEVGVITMPVFILLTLVYFINRALIKTVKKLKKKKPSGEEGPKI